MKILERSLLILIVLSLLAKIVPLAGRSGLVLTIAALTLSCLYFFLGFAVFTKVGFRRIFKWDSYKHLKSWDIIIAIVAGVAFSVLVISLLFKVQYWPGAYYMSRAGLIMLFIIIIVAVFMLKTVNSFIYIGILKRGVPLFLFVLLLQLLPLTARLKIFKVAPEIETQILMNPNGL